MSAFDVVPPALPAALAIGYLAGVLRLRRRGDRWPSGRTLSMLAGAACLAAALLPPISTDDDRFPVHAAQHVLLGMAGPALVALCAPVTLALRCLRPRPRRALLAVLRSRAAMLLTALPSAVLLEAVGLWVVYLTPVYARLEQEPLLHAAVHLHAVAAGTLLASVLVGVDPVRHRPGVPARLAALVLAGAAHDVVTTTMYARGLPAGGGALADRRLGAQLMYYAGTAVDLALAVVLMAQWWRASGRSLARERRRAAATCPADAPAGAG